MSIVMEGVPSRKADGSPMTTEDFTKICEAGQIREDITLEELEVFKTKCDEAFAVYRQADGVRENALNAYNKLFKQHCEGALKAYEASNTIRDKALREYNELFEMLKTKKRAQGAAAAKHGQNGHTLHQSGIEG